ncbi:MAG: hypothetical protein RI564_02100 [Gracilimonas sp.]|nr:hypothetical protein [Gracilimonas sp.]
MIADHMPFAAAAQELGKIFDFHFINGFATMEKAQNQPDIFSIQNGRLMESPVSGKGSVRDVTSFTGSAFSYPKEAMPVMVFIDGDFSLNPEIAWQFVEETETVSLSGYAQGALLKYEKGRIAVFGEAAMFTAQIIQLPNGDGFKVGLNNKQLAPNNIRFLLNLIHGWMLTK